MDDDAGPEGFAAWTAQAKIDWVLPEARAVLPGILLFLGIQLALLVTPGFGALDPRARLLHLGSLGLVGGSILLWLRPALYRRPPAPCTGARLLLAALAVYVLGFVGDMGLAIERITGSWAGAGIGSALLLGCCAALGWGLPRRRPRRP